MNADRRGEVHSRYFKRSKEKKMNYMIIISSNVMRRSRFGKIGIYWGWHYWQNGSVNGEGSAFHNSWRVCTYSNQMERGKHFPLVLWQQRTRSLVCVNDQAAEQIDMHQLSCISLALVHVNSVLYCLV